MQPAVFLDRDNTLIANDGDLGDPALVRLCDGVAEGLVALRRHGFRLVVVTNQAGVARGAFTEHDVDAVHQRIASLVEEASHWRGLIDRFYYCPYHPEGRIREYQQDHPWRKPHPGMLLEAAHDMELDLSRSWMIGDQVRDIQAGAAAGCRTVLVGKNGGTIIEPRPTATAYTFADAVRVILSRETLETSPLERAAQYEPPSRAAVETGATDLRRAIVDLTEEIRAAEAHRREFSYLKMTAVVCQLLVLLLATLGMLQLAQSDVFYKWMFAAVLVQLAAIALVLLDGRS